MGLAESHGFLSYKSYAPPGLLIFALSIFCGLMPTVIKIKLFQSFSVNH